MVAPDVIVLPSHRVLFAQHVEEAVATVPGDALIELWVHPATRGYGASCFASTTVCERLVAVRLEPADGATGRTVGWRRLRRLVVAIGVYEPNLVRLIQRLVPPEPDTATVGGEAFSGCVALTVAAVPDGVTLIAPSAFAGCSALTTVAFPSSTYFISPQVFHRCTSLTTIVFPPKVKLLCSDMFAECINLTSITLPDSLKTIQSGAFKGCTSLASITIPTAVTLIGAWAFQGCTSLTSIVIPVSVTHITFFTFRGCTALATVVIPADSEITINEQAFPKHTQRVTVEQYAAMVRDSLVAC
jgi:hypothetical protein